MASAGQINNSQILRSNIPQDYSLPNPNDNRSLVGSFLRDLVAAKSTASESPTVNTTDSQIKQLGWTTAGTRVDAGLV